MGLPKRHIVYLLLAFFCLIFGFLNYLFFQPNILLFSYFNIESSSHYQFKKNYISHFLRGYFSDVMWCIALCLITIVLSERNYLQLKGRLVIFILPFLLETAQYFGVIQGTFDWFDILTYFLIFLVFVLFNLNLLKNQNEKV